MSKLKLVTIDSYADPSDLIRYLGEYFAGKKWSRAEAKAVRDFVDLVLWEGPNKHIAAAWRREETALEIIGAVCLDGVLGEVRRSVAKVLRRQDWPDLADNARELRRIADYLDTLVEAANERLTEGAVEPQ